MKSPKPFDNGIDGTRRVLGWIYLPVHVFLLPCGPARRTAG